MTNNEKKGDGDIMVQVPLTILMQRIADDAAEKAVRKYDVSLESRICEKIQTHRITCEAAKEVAAFKNKISGLLFGVFVAGGTGGAGAVALLKWLVA
jgi:hypothetical protein